MKAHHKASLDNVPVIAGIAFGALCFILALAVLVL
jgi:hypothetical protein